MKVFWKGFEESQPGHLGWKLIPGPGNVSAPERNWRSWWRQAFPRIWLGWETSNRSGIRTPSGYYAAVSNTAASVRNDIWPILFDDLSYDGRIYAAARHGCEHVLLQ